MPVAPRFNPEGVRVGSMPVPQVRPQTGMAEGLASVGESIAGLGRTVDQVQQNQAQREHAAAMQAKAKHDADQTAGNSIYLDWEAQEDQRNADYRTSNGRIAIDKYQDYTKATTQSVDGFVEGKGLSEGAIAAFKQKASRKLRNYGALANTHLQNENQKYVEATEGRILQSSINDASFALAGNKPEDAAFAFKDAIASAVRISSVTGIPADPEKIANEAYYGAMVRLDKSNRPDQTLNFYKKNADKFGVRQGDAEAMARNSADKVYVAELTKVADELGRDQYGNFDPQKAAAAVRKESGRMSDPLLKPNPSRDKDVETSLKALAAADEAKRAEIGMEAHQIVSEKFLQPFGASQVEAWMKTPYVKNQILSRMNDKDYAKLFERAASGPTHTNPVDAQRIEAMLADGAVPADQIQKTLPGMVLSNERRGTYAKALQSREESRGKAEWDAVEKLWDIQGRKDPSLRKVSYNDKMGEDESKRLINTTAAFTQIVAGLVKDKKPLSMENLDSAFNEYAATVDFANSGDVNTKRVMDVTKEDAAGATPQQINEARASLPSSAPDGAVYLKASQLHADWQVKMSDAAVLGEKANQAEYNDDLASILSAAKQANTFADIEAVRARYGKYARNKVGGTDQVIFELPFVERRAVELRGK